MRVRILILILLAPILLFANKRDSVYNVVFTNYPDSLIYSSFRDTYPNIRGEDWAEDLFNDVIKSYSSSDKDKFEFDTYVVFLTYTDLYKNNAQLKKFLPRLNELSNKFGNYRYYFRAWEMIIKYDVVFDRTEYALIQAD